MLAYTIRIVSWCAWAVNQDDLALSLCLYKSSELGPSGTPDRTWNSRCLQSHPPGTCQNRTFWVVLELYTFCLNIRIASTDCDQDGELLMPKVNRLETLWTAVPRKALWALLVRSGLCPVTPSEWDASQSNSWTFWADLLEIQPLPIEKSFNLKCVFHWTQGEFLWLCMCLWIDSKHNIL